VSPQRIERAIFLIREQKVMLDEDLSILYGVETRALVQAVKRNIRRFPEDFMFRLTADETAGLRSQIVISNVGRGGRRYLPYAFTEQGVAMLSSVLRSERAVAVNVEIMRAFVRLRHILATHKDLARRMADLERGFTHKSKEHEEHIRNIYGILEALTNPPEPPKKGRIGFRPPEDA
jgi:hypothetical protein